jgi:hypothetical protein
LFPDTSANSSVESAPHFSKNVEIFGNAWQVQKGARHRRWLELYRYLAPILSTV